MSEEIYCNNYGRGPGLARIISLTRQKVAFEYKGSARATRWTRAELPRAFFFSERCGWRKAKAETKR